MSQDWFFWSICTKPPERTLWINNMKSYHNPDRLWYNPFGALRVWNSYHNTNRPLPSESLRWAWSSIASRDASKIRRGGRASGLKLATTYHVYSTSNRTARAEPLLLIAYGDAQFGWHVPDACPLSLAQ